MDNDSNTMCYYKYLHGIFQQSKYLTVSILTITTTTTTIIIIIIIIIMSSSSTTAPGRFWLPLKGHMLKVNSVLA
jgi:hypothetical protein